MEFVDGSADNTEQAESGDVDALPIDNEDNESGDAKPRDSD